MRPVFLFGRENGVGQPSATGRISGWQESRGGCSGKGVRKFYNNA